MMHLVSRQFLSTAFESDFEHPVLIDRGSRNADLAFFLEEIGDASAAREVAAVLGEDEAQIRRRAVFIVGRNFEEQSDTARRIAFVKMLFVIGRHLALTSSPLDRAVDVLAGHGLRASGENGAAQPCVSAW